MKRLMAVLITVMMIITMMPATVNAKSKKTVYLLTSQTVIGGGGYGRHVIRTTYYKNGFVKKHNGAVVKYNENKMSEVLRNDGIEKMLYNKKWVLVGTDQYDRDSTTKKMELIGHDKYSYKKGRVVEDVSLFYGTWGEDTYRRYTYDKKRRVIQEEFGWFPDGANTLTKYRYGKKGILSQVSEDGHVIIRLKKVKFDKKGNVISARYELGNSDAGMVTVKYKYKKKRVTKKMYGAIMRQQQTVPLPEYSSVGIGIKTAGIFDACDWDEDDDEDGGE